MAATHTRQALLVCLATVGIAAGLAAIPANDRAGVAPASASIEGGIAPTYCTSKVYLAASACFRSGFYLVTGAADQVPLAHWGWWHYRKLLSYARTKKVIYQLEDIRDALYAASLMLAINPAAFAAHMLANGVIAIGLSRLATSFSRALTSRGTRFDAGLRCANVPFAPDPCWPVFKVRGR